LRRQLPALEPRQRLLVAPGNVKAFVPADIRKGAVQRARIIRSN